MTPDTVKGPMTAREWLDTVEADLLNRPPYLTDPLADAARDMAAAIRTVLDQPDKPGGRGVTTNGPLSQAARTWGDESWVAGYNAALTDLRAAIDTHLGGAS